MKWETLRADKYCIAVKDGTHDTPKQVDFGYKLVTGKHIKNGQIDSSSAYYISEDDYNAINRRSLVEQWDVIMSMIGTVGEAAVVKNNPDYAIKNVALFKCGGSEIRGKWLCYYLNSPEGKGRMLGEMKGSSQQFLSLKQLRELPIMFSEEKVPRIVEMISNYDDLIENNQKQIKLLEEAAQRLYKEWFVDLRFPGHENTKIVDGVPEGWHRGTIGQIAEFKRGRTITKAQVKEGNVPVIAGGLEPAYYHNVANTKAPVITISASGANAGFVRLYGVDVFASDCSFVDGLGTESLFFVYEFLKESKVSIDQLQKGSAQPHVYAKDINAMKITIPEKEYLERFDRYVKVYFNKIKTLQGQNERLKTARDLLLPKLMSGEAEV